MVHSPLSDFTLSHTNLPASIFSTGPILFLNMKNVMRTSTGWRVGVSCGGRETVEGRRNLVRDKIHLEHLVSQESRTIKGETGKMTSGHQPTQPSSTMRINISVTQKKKTQD